MNKGRQNNLKLLAGLVILIIVSVILGLSNTSSTSSEVDKRQFAVDPNTVISDVLLKRPEGNLKLSYVDQNWIVNDKFPMDIRMRDTFFSILSSLEVRRPVARSQQDSIADWLDAFGTSVEISYLQEPVRSYLIGGNEENGVTYVMGNEREPYIAVLPGYQNYIAGIFNVPELDWKNRSVFNTDWLSLGGLTWDYTDDSKDDIVFVPGKPLFTIEDLPNIDSTRAMNYLEELIFLQVDRYITASEAGQFKTQPFLTCTLDDRQLGTQQLVIYIPAEDQQFALAEINGSMYGLIRWSRIQGYFLEPEDLDVEP